MRTHAILTVSFHDIIFWNPCLIIIYVMVSNYLTDKFLMEGLHSWVLEIELWDSLLGGTQPLFDYNNSTIYSN